MSGIYIPGMEMPTSCYKCNLKKIWEDGVQCLVNKGLWMDCDSKHKACPLVPVPPHGRLIDADALMKHKGDCYDANGHLLYAIGTGNIMCAPTIIPASTADKEETE